MYKITDYSFKKAKQLNVTIRPSGNKKKKIDVIKDGQVVASIGAKGYKDFPTYIQENGKAYADQRRKLYKMRHKKDVNNKSGNGFYADKILW
jgi:hypothetical protein